MSINGAALIHEITEEIDLLLSEDKMAQAAALLFDLHKGHRSIWIDLKVALLKSAFGHRELFLMASILNVAEKDDLSQSFHLVPGLYALRRPSDEIL